MKKSRYTEGQIIKALKEEENGRSVMDISREFGLNPHTFTSKSIEKNSLFINNRFNVIPVTSVQPNKWTR
jgi:hypothetical protein